MKTTFVGEGNIGLDPVLKYVPVQGVQKPVLEFDVRIAYDKLNTETGEYEDNGGFWIAVSYWGKRAETANKILKSGVRVIVVGEISQDEFVASKGDRVGQTITVINVSATHIGLSSLGIDSVNFTPRRKRDSPSSVDQLADPALIEV